MQFNTGHEAYTPHGKGHELADVRGFGGHIAMQNGFGGGNCFRVLVALAVVG